ncbi:MAG: hypothetical protein M3N45_00590 [Actinomycetota bacterium]|nr:hypothetical protein [Actinomycetota bacterium]
MTGTPGVFPCAIPISTGRAAPLAASGAAGREWRHQRGGAGDQGAVEDEHPDGTYDARRHSPKEALNARALRRYQHHREQHCAARDLAPKRE